MARDFSGASTNRIDCGSAASLDDISTLTYCAWIYPTSVTATRPIMQKNGGSGKRLRLNGAVRSGGVQWAIAHATTNADAQAATGTITINTWQFIAATLSSSVPKIYRGVPGGAVAEVSYAAAPTTGVGSLSPDASASLLLGGDTANQFPGRGAEFMFLNRALTVGELTAVMYGSLPSGLLGYWPCYGNAASEPDYGGGKNTGTVTGATQAAHPPIRSRFALQAGWEGAFTAGGGAPATAYPGYYHRYILSRRAA